MGKEILFRGKREDNEGWAEGLAGYDICGNIAELEVYQDYAQCEILTVDPDTVGQYTGLPDKNGRRIFEGDICQWVNAAYGQCTGVVRYGIWEQDGSGGEYAGEKCFGWYLDVAKVRTLNPDMYADFEAEENYPEWLRTISLVDGDIRDLFVVGNIFDNPELIEEDDSK